MSRQMVINPNGQSKYSEGKSTTAVYFGMNGIIF